MLGRSKWMVGALLGLTATATAQPFADSMLQFSGIQGQDGWSYGYYRVGADADGVYDPAADFELFSASDFNGSVWRFAGSGQPATMLSAAGGAPSGTDSPAGEQWAVRRWTSDFAGRVRIDGLFGELDTRGGGTIGRVFVDRTEVFAQLEVASPRPLSVEVRVSAGSTVDLAIDPNGDGRFDLARFSVILTRVPCVADLDENRVIDVFDLLVFLDRWFRGDGDFNGDGVTDPFDLAEFVAVWVGGEANC